MHFFTEPLNTVFILAQSIPFSEPLVALGTLAFLFMSCFVVLQSRSLWTGDNLSQKIVRAALIGAAIFVMSSLDNLVNFEISQFLPDPYIAAILGGGITGVLAGLGTAAVELTKSRHHVSRAIAASTLVLLPVAMLLYWHATHSFIPE